MTGQLFDGHSPIFIQQDSLSRLTVLIDGLANAYTAVLIISTRAVFSIYGQAVKQALASCFPHVKELIVPEGEAAKRFNRRRLVGKKWRIGVWIDKR